MKIKKGDTVMVIAGKDKGKTGTVTAAFPKTASVLVEGVNIKTKHQRNRRTRSQGQIIEKAAPIDVSNVALMEGKKAVRVGYSVETSDKGTKKTRVARPSGKKI
jgi:large subunit ribosomal protein L24